MEEQGMFRDGLLVIALIYKMNYGLARQHLGDCNDRSSVPEGGPLSLCPEGVEILSEGATVSCLPKADIPHTLYR